MSNLTPIPRVPMLSIEEAQKRGAEIGLSESLCPLSVFRVLLQHPTLAKNVGNLLMGLLFEGNVLDARLRELIIMRLGWVTGSNYEWTQHWRVGDMVIWDNRCTMHQRGAFDPASRRLLHRVVVKGERPA